MNIEGGEFFAGGDDTTLLYASGTVAYDPNSDWATINVYGGTFDNEAVGDSVQDYLNVMNHGVGKITIYGGTFDFDPSTTSWDDDAPYITVANGYGVTEDSGKYVVSMIALNDAISGAENGDRIVVPAGNYNFPSVTNTITIECSEGTVFEGISGLNIKGSTVIGATFSNDTGNAVSGTINGIFKDCTFTGSNALRGCYAGETVVFENCIFDGSVYGAHFDGGANDVLFKDCTFSGFNALGSAITQVMMENCVFKSNGKSDYNGINLWGNTTMIGCTFVFDGSASNEWVDLRGNNKEVSFTDCVVTNGSDEKLLADVVGDYGTGNIIMIDNQLYNNS